MTFTKRIRQYRPKILGSVYLFSIILLSPLFVQEEKTVPSLIKIIDERKADEVASEVPAVKEGDVEKMEDDPFIDNFGNGETTNLKIDEEVEP